MLGNTGRYRRRKVTGAQHGRTMVGGQNEVLNSNLGDNKRPRGRPLDRWDKGIAKNAKYRG